MDDDHRHLRSVDGDAQPRPHHRGRATQQWECRVCEERDGVATSALIEIWLTPFRSRGGKFTGGRKALVCAHCFVRGVTTRAT